MEKLDIDGKIFEGYRIPTVSSAILFIKGSRGFLGCGYFNLETADKLGEAVAIVSGVKNFDDMLAASVKAVSRAAAAAGIAVGMSGREALGKMG